MKSLLLVKASAAALCVWTGLVYASTLPPRQVKGANCTDRSLALKTLRVFGGSVARRPGGEATDLRFRLGNPLTGDSELCASSGAGAVVSPSEWANCEHPREPTAPRSSFRYDAAANELAVQGTWICSDRDPENPLALDAFGTGSIPFVCQELADANGAHQCTQESDVEIEVTVSSRSAED